MVIAVGSRNPPKVDAVRSVFRQLAAHHRRFEITQLITRDAPSGTPETPTRLHHLQRGAVHRVQYLRDVFSHLNRVDFYIGLEGGLYQVEIQKTPHTFLQSWVYVQNDSTGFYGSSGNLPVPQAIAHAVFEEDRSLGDIMEEATGKTDIPDQEGAFGTFTQQFITRQHSFETALLCALTPFYNQESYAQSPHESSQ